MSAASRRIALAAAVFAGALLLAEGSHRLWLRARGEPYSPWDTVRKLRERLDFAQSFVRPVGGPQRDRLTAGSIGILHPYFGSERGPDTGKVLEHFRRGVPEDEYTVVVVGGSVAASFAFHCGKSLGALLEQDPRLAGRKVTTLNYAHPGFKQPQQLTRVVTLLSLGYKPDAVINLDGFNEVALALENSDQGTHPAFPSFPQWGVLVQDYGGLDPGDLDIALEIWGIRRRAERLFDRFIALRLYHSSLLGTAALRSMDVLNRERADLQARLAARSTGFAANSPMQYQIKGPPIEPNGPDVLDRAVATWLECSRALDAVCGRMGIRYLHVLQPTLADTGSKPLTENEKSIVLPNSAWRRGPEQGYPKLREAGRELAREGTAFLDASMAFSDVGAELYFDPCHFLGRGNEILCDLVARAFLEQALPR